MLKILRKYAKFIALGSLLALALLYISIPTPPNTRDSIAKQMENESTKWFAQERPLSQLEADLKAGKVTAVGVGFDYALVTADANYYIRVGTQRNLLQDILKAKPPTPVLSIISLGDIAPPVAGAAKLGRYIEPGYIVLLFLAVLTGMTAKQMGYLTIGAGKYRVTKEQDLRFSDVIGVEEAKEAMADLVAFLKNPKQFSSLGGKAPRGVLMVGAPGIGKTLLARAVAGEAGVSFISISGSDFSAKYFGAGITNVKELFTTARKNLPCIIFIDEFDSIGKRNPDASNASESENNRIINSFLVELDGFAQNSGVMVIGATNHLDNVDPSVIRPGRFDRVIHLSLPTVAEREQLFAMYTAKLQTAGPLDVKLMARLSTYLSPAAIATVVNAGALLAAKEKAEKVTEEHILRALDTHRIGAPSEAGRAALTEEERERIAYHEAGHAISAALNKVTVEKVTIMPRSMGLGVTQFSGPDKKLYTEAELHTQILLMLGGRAAEKLMLASTSTGASDDLKRATNLAYQMVTQYGFSETVGPLSFAGFPTTAQQESLPPLVLDEVREIMRRMESICDEALSTHRRALELLTAKLLEHEVVLGDVVQECLAVGSAQKIAA